MRLDDLDDGNLDDDVNAEYQRGGRGGGFGFPMGGGGGMPLGGRMGCGTLAIVLIAALVFGVNPGDMLGGGQRRDQPASAGSSSKHRWDCVQHERSDALLLPGSRQQ